MASSNRSDRRNTVPQVAWPYAIKEFTGDDQHIELHPEAYQEPVQFTEQQYYIGITRNSPKKSTHATAF